MVYLVFRASARAATRKHTMVGQNILRGGENIRLGGGQNYNKIDNSKNLRGMGKEALVLPWRICHGNGLRWLSHYMLRLNPVIIVKVLVWFWYVEVKVTYASRLMALILRFQFDYDAIDVVGHGKAQVHFPLICWDLLINPLFVVIKSFIIYKL